MVAPVLEGEVCAVDVQRQAFCGGWKSVVQTDSQGIRRINEDGLDRKGRAVVREIIVTEVGAASVRGNEVAAEAARGEGLYSQRARPDCGLSLDLHGKGQQGDDGQEPA